jgi:antitoxin (DNA-binding transcriptional repressor) of toxin-antitoxin stability system
MFSLPRFHIGKAGFVFEFFHIDNLTILGHHKVMNKVKVAEFKSHLSAHLREVRKGREIVVYDRHQPIAKVIPFAEPKRTITVRPPRNKGSLKDLQFPPLSTDFDVVEMLREDRDYR